MVASNGSLQPRKTPVQARGRETCERILDAAAHVFTEYGYAAGTTNRVAEAASVSIGSLYQYFPNKDAILVALTMRHIAEGRARVVELFAAGIPDSLDEIVRVAVVALVELHADDRALHRVLFEEAPRPPGVVAELHAVEDELVGLLVSVLAQYPERRRDVDAELQARFVVVTVESLVHRLVAGDRPIDVDAVTREVTHLVVSYLVTPVLQA